MSSATTSIPNALSIANAQYPSPAPTSTHETDASRSALSARLVGVANAKSRHGHTLAPSLHSCTSFGHGGGGGVPSPVVVARPRVFLFASAAALRPAASTSAAVTAPVAVSNHVASAVLDLRIASSHSHSRAPSRTSSLTADATDDTNLLTVETSAPQRPCDAVTAARYAAGLGHHDPSPLVHPHDLWWYAIAYMASSRATATATAAGESRVSSAGSVSRRVRSTGSIDFPTPPPPPPPIAAMAAAKGSIPSPRSPPLFSFRPPPRPTPPPASSSATFASASAARTVAAISSSGAISTERPVLTTPGLRPSVPSRRMRATSRLNAPAAECAASTAVTHQSRRRSTAAQSLAHDTAAESDANAASEGAKVGLDDDSKDLGAPGGSMPYARRRTSSSDVVPRSASFAGVGAPRPGGTSDGPSPSLSRRRLHPDDRCAARTALGSGESSHPATATGAAASCASWTSSTTARLGRLPRALGTLRRSAASTPTFRLRTTWTSGGKGRANLSRLSRRGTRTSSGMGSHSRPTSRRVSRAGMASQTRPPPRARSFGAVPPKPSQKN